ncbi:MAG: heavy metal translocating P-type ATPase [Candidatus Heimdallarchaeum aukensis]|uniref:Heavy metal translocating P-type ATPase n=1 Tax=Candidatus Heimdallarchaeum aukensis TaxID=2876573 RepID=A0A9Y1BKB7_9ARCH|nr:MAG: heavy metal translocating P-type ATPase [Candidatus Heimdallarchaeum aukensis]
MTNEDTIILTVEGMTCSSCVSRVEKALKSVQGVNSAEVNLLSHQAKVTYDSNLVSLGLLIDAVSSSGYKASLPSKEENKVSLSIEGMTCSSCVNTIEKNLSKLEGIRDVKVVLANNSAVLAVDPEKIDFDRVLSTVKDLGYKAKIMKESEQALSYSKNKHLIDMRNRFWISLMLSIPVFIFAMGHMVPFKNWFPAFAEWQRTFYIFPGMPFSIFVQLILTTPIQFIISYPFYRAAWKSITHKSASMDVLVVIGTTAAYLYSLFTIVYKYFVPVYEGQVFFETSAILLTFIFLGKYLEEVTKGRTSEAIKKLIELRPKTAKVERDGKELEIPVDDVVVGDICLIRPGDSVPVDGVVIDGQSYVNESMITGESIPVFKDKGDTVIGGTINENGFIKVEATKVGKDTTLNQIIKMVENAQTSKLPIQKLADTISNYFVPAVILIALIAFVTWFTLFSVGVVSVDILPAGTSIFLFSFLVGIAVIVISCPCALGLATPTAIMVGTGLGAQNGILIRTGEALERAKNIETILLDKTGTITKGNPEVTDIISLNDTLKEEEILAIAGSLEQGSEHSIAQAIRNHALEKELTLSELKDFEAIPGKGVKANLLDNQYFFGNRKLLNDLNLELTQSITEILNSLENEGKTAMILVENNVPLGIVAIADTIKENSPEAIALMKKMGLNVVMVSGDNERAAKAIAKLVGIEEVHADVLPEDKLKIVKIYQEKGHQVAFVGDGINDAPALAQSDIGIAIGSGTDVAIETGDIILIKDDLRDVVTAIDLSKKTIRKVKLGLFWALFYNSLAIPIAAGILFIPFGFVLPAEIAGLAMAMSSVSVVLNSLTLKRYKNPFQKTSKSKVAL